MDDDEEALAATVAPAAVVHASARPAWHVHAPERASQEARGAAAAHPSSQQTPAVAAAAEALVVTAKSWHSPRVPHDSEPRQKDPTPCVHAEVEAGA